MMTWRYIEMARKQFFIPAITILLLIAIVGCGGDAAETVEMKEKGDLAEFSIKTYEGDTITPADYRGKVLMVDYWATWCAPCRKEFPHFNKLLDTYGDDLVIIAITTDTDMTLLGNFLDENPLRYIIGLSGESDIASWPDPADIPQAYIIDREGYIRAHLEGGHKFEDFDKIIKPLVDEKPAAPSAEEIPVETIPDTASEDDNVEEPIETETDGG
jgi:thiol-disulfide isomerase/thioredoxin